MFFKPKAVQIQLTKHQKNDDYFVLPVRCVYCASTHVMYTVELYNQHRTSISRVMQMIFGIFYVLFAFLRQDKRESYEAYACERCQYFVEQRQKARKWLFVKWILVSIILFFIFLWAIYIGYENEYLSGNTTLIVSIVSAIGWLIGSHLWAKSFQINLRRQYHLSEASLAPDLVLDNLKIFPVGFTWSERRGRFRMTARVRDVDYLQELITQNQAQCTIHYSQAHKHRLAQVRPSANQPISSLHR